MEEGRRCLGRCSARATFCRQHLLAPPFDKSQGHPPPFLPSSSPPTDPYLVQRYGSLSASPVRLMNKTYFGVKSQPDEQVGVALRSTGILWCGGRLGGDG